MILFLQGLDAVMSCALTSSTGCRRCCALTGGGVSHVAVRTLWLQCKLTTKASAALFTSVDFPLLPLTALQLGQKFQRQYLAS
jgi:hypothetical protein